MGYVLLAHSDASVVIHLPLAPNAHHNIISISILLNVSHVIKDAMNVFLPQSALTVILDIICRQQMEPSMQVALNVRLLALNAKELRPIVLSVHQGMSSLRQGHVLNVIQDVWLVIVISDVSSALQDS